MKLNKIIGIAVAAGGVAISMATAAALYVGAAQQTGFGIGAEYTGETGTITYKINGSTSGTATPEYLKNDGTNGGTGIGDVYTQVHYSFPLSAVFSNDMIEQSYVVGNFSITFSTINTNLVNNAVVSVVGNGYAANSLGDHYYKAIATDQTVTDTSVTINKDIAILAKGGVSGQTIDVYFKVTSTASLNLYTLDEASLFSVSVSWGSPSESFDKAYVVGGKTKWNVDEYYCMAPNINKAYSEGWEWIYEALPGDMGKSKCVVGSSYSTGDDADLDSSKTYDVYWAGAGTAATYTARP